MLTISKIGLHVSKPTKNTESNRFPQYLSFQISETVKVCLPKLEIEKFNGAVINWSSFCDQFSSAIHRNSSVKWSRLGQILNFKKIGLGQTLKSQVKNKFLFPCIPIFWICNYKKGTMWITKLFFCVCVLPPKSKSKAKTWHTVSLYTHIWKIVTIKRTIGINTLKIKH